MPGQNDGENGSADERTPLTHGGSLGNRAHLHGLDGSGNKPLHQDDRAWVRWPMNFLHLTWQTLASNYVNILLVFVPAGIALGMTGANPTAVFVVNFFAIVPLASLLSFATEELSVKLGQTIGGLMNATFGNAVELIVGLLPCFSYLVIQSLITLSRSASSLSGRARFASFSPACLVPSCPISSSSWDAVSSPQELGALRAHSMRLLPPPCPPSWPSPRPR